MADMISTKCNRGTETGGQILFHLFAYTRAYPFCFPGLQSATMSWIQVNVTIPKRYSLTVDSFQKRFCVSNNR